MWLLLIAVCVNSQVLSTCAYVTTEMTFRTFEQCFIVRHAARMNKESAAWIEDYRCVKVRDV